MPEAKKFGGQTMAGRLRRVLVCDPKGAGWFRAEAVGRWRELGYFHEPQADLAQSQHQALKGCLEQAGVEVISLPAREELSIDSVFAHDASLLTDGGAICMQMGKANRVVEADRHANFYRELDIPVLGRIREPGTTEAGDMVWLDGQTLLVGRSYRTNAAGIHQMEELLEPLGAKVMEAPLSHGRGPEFCLHLMSVMSVLDEKTLLVDMPGLAVSTVEMLQARNFRLVEIDDSERETMACNVLSLGGNQLVALRENTKTNQRLSESGFEVLTFPGTELCQNGSGGPTCLTRPLHRE